MEMLQIGVYTVASADDGLRCVKAEILHYFKWASGRISSEPAPKTLVSLHAISCPPKLTLRISDDLRATDFQHETHITIQLHSILNRK